MTSRKKEVPILEMCGTKRDLANLIDRWFTGLAACFISSEKSYFTTAMIACF